MSSIPVDAAQDHSSNGPKPPDELCDLGFRCSLMQDPVIAADGFTYERCYIQQWMQGHDVSPRTGQPFLHTFLTPNVMARQLIAAWCEKNDLPVPSAPSCDLQQAGVHKPAVTCAAHPKEQLRVFCSDCGHGICILCAVDAKRCKTHATEALDTLLEDLRRDRECWVQAHEDCRSSIEQLCICIQADADSKKQAIDIEAAALLQKARTAVDERVTALAATAEKRQQREQLVAAAADSPELGLKGSAAAVTIAAAVNRFKAPVPDVHAAEFRPAAAPALAVGQVVVLSIARDLEDEDARKAAAEETALTVAVQALGQLGCSALLGRVRDRNLVTQLEVLLQTKLQHRSYKLLYTWSKDGSSNASFHRHCDNQGATLVIVRSATGHTFGGYAAASWSSAGAYSNAAECFLFLVENPNGDAPTCFECATAARAIYCHAARGPCFGIGHDMGIHVDGDTARSYTNFSNTYTDTLGRGELTFTGAHDFTPEDYEVWAVT